MSDQVTEQTQEKTETLNTASSPFSSESWGDIAPEPQKAEEKASDVVAEATPASTPETPAAAAPAQPGEVEEILDPKDWLKREFDVDDAAVLKAEREEYKKLKEQAPQEIKFENEQSKQIHELLRQGKIKEVREFLETQEKLETVSSAEVNKDTAGEIIKMGMSMKYKDLTPKEIEYKYNKQFSLPKQPVQLEDEAPEDYEQRKAEWQEKVSEIEMEKIIEAKLAKPELEKFKSTIVLPELEKPTPKQDEPSQESLEANKRWAENFISTLESNFSKVEGFSTKVKDESVEIPIAFKIPDEDKVAIKGKLAQGFDVTDFFSKRWFDDKNNPVINQMIGDLYLLENLDKILSGVANNSANLRLKEYLKEKSLITIDPKTPQQTFQPEQNGNSQNPFKQDSWSEKPPILQN